MNIFFRLTLTGWFILLVFSCKDSPVSQSSDWFRSVKAEESNVYFSNEIDPFDSINIINYLYAFNGGGVALGDINADGLLDIFFTANRGPNKLYVNKGGLQFEDVTEKSGILSDDSWSTGVTIVDINRDGHNDIYVCNVFNDVQLSGVNRLYVNKGNGEFVEDAAGFGLDISALSTQAAFFDYDNDGDLDMYLLCHSLHSPGNYSNASIRNKVDSLSGDRLFENRNGRFRDVSKSSGIFRSQLGYGLGLVVGDMNMDGWQDIFVGNDFHENDYLYINQKDGTFSEVNNIAFTHSSRFSMGADFGDLNNDGFPDIVSLDMKPKDEKVLKNSEAPESNQIFELKSSYGYHYQYAHNALHLHTGLVKGDVPIYTECAQQFEIEATDWSWSVLIEDYNLDGHQDLFITNGILHRPNDMDYMRYISDEVVRKNDSDEALIRNMPAGPVPNFLYANNGFGFSEISDLLGDNPAGVSQGAAYGDLDNDGDLDLVVNNTNRSADILENKVVGNHFIKLNLKRGDYKPVQGTKVWLYSNMGNQYKEVHMVKGFQSSSNDKLVFGLGDNTEIDSLYILWPDQSSTSIVDIALDKETTIDQENVPKSVLRKAAFTNPMFRIENADETLPYNHKENMYDDFINDKLSIAKLSQEGPAAATADVNGDGILDIFLGGARGSPGAIYIQGKDGRFSKGWGCNELFEDVDAAFTDIDKDGDEDLIVLSGGGDLQEGHYLLSDRLYMNDGRGSFKESYYFIDNQKVNSAAVAIADFDKDGWDDIFIAGRSVPGSYGLSPKNRLFKNDQGRDFIEIVSKTSEEQFTMTGMNTDVLWDDLDNNGFPDLVIVGHWSPITIFWNNGSALLPEKIGNSSGMWNTVYSTDINNDGLPDLLVGNMGLNHSLKSDDNYPLRLYVNDFNNDQLLDPIITYVKDGREYTFHHMSALGEQMNDLENFKNSYRDFSESGILDLFGEEKLKASFVREINELRSVALINLGNGEFEIVALPWPLQSYPIYAFYPLQSDLGQSYLVGGNNFGFAPIIGRQDGGYVDVLSYSDAFIVLPHKQTGLMVEGEVRSFFRIDNPTMNSRYLVVKNDDKPIWLLPTKSNL